MCRIKCKVEDGLVRQEKIVSFLTAEGNEEQVPMYAELVDMSAPQPSFRADVVEQQPDKLLIELPNESASGGWRYVVNRSEVLEA